LECSLLGINTVRNKSSQVRTHYVANQEEEC
jgi:hypothetical protein